MSTPTSWKKEYAAKFLDEPSPLGGASWAARWAEYVSPRQVGKTHALCEAAKKIGATVVCISGADAKRVRKEHGVKTISLDSPDEARGKTLLFDTDAVSVLVRRLATPYQELRAQAAQAADAVRLLRRLATTSLSLAAYDDVLREVREFLGDVPEAPEEPDGGMAEKMRGLEALASYDALTSTAIPSSSMIAWSSPTVVAGSVLTHEAVQRVMVLARNRAGMFRAEAEARHRREMNLRYQEEIYLEVPHAERRAMIDAMTSGITIHNPSGTAVTLPASEFMAPGHVIYYSGSNMTPETVLPTPILATNFQEE